MSIVFKFFILLIFLNFQLFAFDAQKSVDKISKLIAVDLYNVEPESAQKYISLIIEKNKKNIIAFRLIDPIDNSIVYEYRKDDISFDNLQKNLHVGYKVLKHNILYGDDLVGKIILYYQTDSSINLSPKEREWIKNNTVIVGTYPWKPAIFSNSKKDIDGIFGDYIKLFIQKTGLKVKVVSGEFDTIMRKFKQHKIDIVPSVYYNKERAKIALFSEPIFKVRDAIYVRSQNHDIYSLQNLRNKTVAITKGYATIGKIKKRFPDIKIVETKSLNDSINRVLSGKVDAFYEGELVANYKIKNELIKGLKSVLVKAFDAPSLYFMSSKNKPILHTIIQKALKSIDYEDRDKIITKWIGETGRIRLNTKEKEWLLKYGTIKYVTDNDWKPLEWIDELRQQTGILSDLLLLISQKSGIRFKLVLTKKWSKAVAKVKNRQADMLDSVGETKERQTYLDFTNKAFFTTPYVFVSRLKESYLNGFDDVVDKKVAVLKDSTIDGILKENRPNFHYLKIESATDGFKKVQSKNIDIFIVNAATAKYFINILGYDNLQISYKTNYTLKLKLALRKGMPKEVLSILNKSIDAISKKEMNDIIYKWTNITVKTKTNWTLIFEIASVIFLVVLFVIWNNRKLSMLVQEKTEDLALQNKQLEDLSRDLELKVNERTKELMEQKEFVTTLLDSQEQIIITTDGKQITQANQAFLDLFEVSSIEDFMERFNATCICDTFDIDTSLRYLQKRMNGVSWIDYVINHSDEVMKASITHNGRNYLFSVTGANLSGKIGLKTATFTDITAIEQARHKIEELHKHTKDSIEYASLIQGALIPENTLFQKYFVDYFTIWQPKDIVGGDIYLFEPLRDKSEYLLMVIDCTGHGVPGAFVTMLVKAIERQVVAKIENDPSIDVSPAWILGYFNRKMKQLLKQERRDSLSNAGFDGGIIYYNNKAKILKFAGAQTPLFYIKDEELKIIKGNRHSIGYKTSDASFEFNEEVISVEDGMQFYLTTDGYLDQNGGKKGFPFGKRRFKEIISANQNLSFLRQKELFMEELGKYQRAYERNDDITIIGFKS